MNRKTRTLSCRSIGELQRHLLFLLAIKKGASVGSAGSGRAGASAFPDEGLSHHRPPWERASWRSFKASGRLSQSVPMWHPLRLAEDTGGPIGRITILSAKFTDAPEGGSGHSARLR